MTVPGKGSSQLDPAARWREHYDAVEERRRAIGAVRRHLRPRLPGAFRTRQTAVKALIAFSVVLVSAALAILWL
jgi:hypothetical protein